MGGKSSGIMWVGHEEAGMEAGSGADGMAPSAEDFITRPKHAAFVSGAIACWYV